MFPNKGLDASGSDIFTKRNIIMTTAIFFDPISAVDPAPDMPYGS
jgi:hypothetical protein